MLERRIRKRTITNILNDTFVVYGIEIKQPYSWVEVVNFIDKDLFEKYINNNKEIIFEKTCDWETRKDL